MWTFLLQHSAQYLTSSWLQRDCPFGRVFKLYLLKGQVLHFARNIVETYNENKFTDFFKFYLTSVNLLLSSVLRLSTAEAHFASSVAKHSDKLEKCVKSPYCTRSSHTWSVYQTIWCDQTDCELSYICLACCGGGTKMLGGPHAARGPRVKDPWPTMFIGAEMSVSWR